MPNGSILAGLRPLHRPNNQRWCALSRGAAGGTNGSHPQQQQPVLDELMLALMQRRAQQGQPPLAQAPLVPPVSGSQPAAPEQLPLEQGAFAAGLPLAAAQQAASVPASSTSAAPVAEPVPATAAALALAAYADAVAQRPLASVRFSLRLHTQPGQRVRVVGGGDELGMWDALAAPELRCTGSDLWQATLQLPAGCIVEYKYVILDHSGRNVLAWQEGNNNVLAVRLSDESLEVADNWCGDMRGQVVSAGGAAETRESRLLAWAGDLFVQLSSQRAELRRSRLELAGAREAEQEARDEALFHKAQHKAKESERAEAVAALAEVQALNRAMEEQLTDTTHALLEAIETADALLTANTDAEGSDASDTDADEEPAVPAPRRGRRSAASAAAVGSAAPAPRRGRPRKAPAAAASAAADDEPAEEGAAAAGAAPKPRRRRAKKAAAAE